VNSVIGESRRKEYVYPTLTSRTIDSIIYRAPTRIDFGGGWTDVPPYSDEMGGYVCNVAISRFATVTVTRGGPARPADETVADRSITDAAARRFRIYDARIDVESDFPISAGLGGSSAVGVATVAALAAARGEKMSPNAIAELSREIEINDLGIAGGRQDHYAASYGGALGLRFLPGRVDVRTINLSARTRAELERRCMIIYTGKSRISADTINAVLGAYRDREPRVIAALAAMRGLAERMADTLAAGDVDKLARLVAEQWEHQRALHPEIPTPRIDEIIAVARDAGALGSKALGASGGGCVLVMAARDRVDNVRSAIAPLGEMLPFTIDMTGVERCR
jgi:D-glycero-alpha-D-manno-heptose-7-phosphate kinase